MIVKGTSNDSQTIVKGTSNDSQMIVKKDILDLSGFQYNAMVFMVNNLEASKSKITIKLNTKVLASALNSNKSMVLQVIYRLRNKGFILLHKQKKGRGGWCQYKLNLDVLEAKSSIQKLLLSPIYNSNNKLTTITIKEKEEERKISEPVNVETPEQLDNQFNDSWNNIDTSALDNHGISKGFVHNIKKLNTVSAEIAQESINHFGFRMDQGEIPDKWKNPLSVLFGTLKKGGAWVEAGYRSPQEIADDKRIEIKREEIQRKRMRQMEELELAFEEWSMELGYDEKKAMVSQEAYDGTLKLLGAAEAQQWLETEIKAKFETEIYKK